MTWLLIPLGLLVLYVGFMTALWWFEANWLHGDTRLRGFRNWFRFVLRRYP